MDISMGVGQSSSLNGAECWRLSLRELDFYWPKLEEALDKEPKLWDGAFTKETLREAIEEFRVQVWVLSEGEEIVLAFMTQSYLPPNGVRRLQVFWVFGQKLVEYLPLIDMVLDRFAAKLECGVIEGQGRRGFERLVRPLGYEFEYVTYSRPVRASKGN